MPTLTDLDPTVVLTATDVATPQSIDIGVTVADAEQDWQGGTIVISGMLSGDTVSIANIGAGAGQISVSGGLIYYQGTLIGSFSGGVGAALEIALFAPGANDNAAVEALLEALRFSTSGTLIVSRTLTYTLTDAASNVTSGAIDVQITGDAAANTLKGTAAGETIDGAGGGDLLRGEGGDDVLIGALGDDNLVGGTGDDTLDGGADNDILNGGAGADTMGGGAGDDTYYVDDAGDATLENSGEGADTVRASINWMLGADLENLILTGTASQGFGNSDANAITGNTADNFLYGDAGNDTLKGMAGADELLGGDGDDNLDGGTGDDILNGGADNDILRGGAGADQLDGGGGDDDMDGGTGDDLYWVNNAGDTVAETVANGGHDTVYANITFTLTSQIEDLILYGPGALDGTGNGLANAITGNDSANVLDGGGGNDNLEGGLGDDTLIGGAGADLLDGGVGADDMAGGAGNDTYQVDDAGDTVAEASGEGYDTVNAAADFTLQAGVEVEVIRAVAGLGGLTLGGNELNNRLYGADGDDVLSGGGGADMLDGGLGADQMSGGDGDDTYYVDNLNDGVTELGGEGIDTVHVTTGNYYMGENVEYLYGDSTAAQRLGGNSADNRIYGNIGDDIIGGQDGDDLLMGYGGDDRLNGGLGDDTLRGGEGDDSYWVDGDDHIVELAGEGADTVYTLVDWTLEENVENLIMIGTDNLVAGGNSAGNVMTGNGGWNDLYGGDGDDTLNGLAGDDLLVGEDGDDILNGGGGSDTLVGGAGADQMFGGAGDDAYFVDDTGDVTTDIAGGGIDVVISTATTTLGAFIEILYLNPEAGDIDGTGNAIDNLIQGNEGANVISGLAGRDSLLGGAGADTLYGGDGDDFLDDGYDTNIDDLYGGAGRDQLVGSVGDFLYGGTGNDEYSVTQDGINIIEYDGEGYDTVYAQVSYTLTDFVEKLDLMCFGGDIDGTGSAQANTILGNCHVNILNGMAGNDILDAGDDDDTLIGGLGNDRMTGGLGADTFVIENSDMVSTVLGQTRQADIILDLDFDEGDRIDLSGIDADINTDGDQDFSLVSKFGKHAGEAQLVYNAVKDQTTLQLDIDGDGKADYHLTIYGDATTGLLLAGSEPAGTGGWLGFDMSS